MYQDIASDELSDSVNPRTEYTIYTLIDITDSGVISPKKSKTGFHQAQNLNSFLQTLGLRTQILSYNSEQISGDFSEYKFDYSGNGNIWKLTFWAEATLPWTKDNDGLYWLIRDFSGIPIHTGLNESVDIDPEVINTSVTVGKINTRFTKSDFA